MEIALATKSQSADPPKTHGVMVFLKADIKNEKTKAIGIGLIEDIAAPKGENWTPSSYAHAKLQSTQSRDQLYINH